MKPVAKYNVCKAFSTALTIGTPIVTLCSCSDFFVHRSDTAISAAGVFAILICALFFKDKIAENFKIPSAFVISTCMLIAICIIDSLILPLKYVSLATMCATGVDELTFKRMYKNVEVTFSDKVAVNKIAGFIFGSSDKLTGGM